MKRLDQLALDVEFLLISVIQGVALATLATAAVGPLNTLQFATWPYIAAAFLIILIFWSGAIIHAVSFVDWPIDLPHSFLYFLTSLVEILAVYNLSNPLLWYVFMFFFNVVGIGLYAYDLWLIKQHKKKYSDSTAGKKLFSTMMTDQKRELAIYLPASLVFNVVAILLLLIYRQVFIVEHYHLVFIGLQLVFAVVFLGQELRTFKKRSELIIAAEK